MMSVARLSPTIAQRLNAIDPPCIAGSSPTRSDNLAT
jgi:hypothetical protein